MGGDHPSLITRRSALASFGGIAVSSNTFDYWKGPHDKAIIALGPGIIPYLIKQVKAGDFWFNVRLALITHVDIANGKYDSEQANSKLWVEWWESANK